MSMVDCTFSIIIPTYNRPRQLKECLTALADLASPKDWYEVIVVDDGSSAPLNELVASLTPRMQCFLVRQENRGPAAARNAGVRHSRGRFLAFTDDDCLPDRQWLNAFFLSLEGKAERLVGGRTINLLSDNPYAQTSQKIIELVHHHYHSTTSGGPLFFSSNNIALSAGLYRTIGGFDPDFRTAEDRDLCDRLRLGGYPLVYQAAALVGHAHDLGLCSFWQLYVAYGRGAFLFNRAHARRAPGSSTLDFGFYRTVLVQCLKMLGARPLARSWLMTWLLVLWNVANLVGFFSEATRSRTSSGNKE